MAEEKKTGKGSFGGKRNTNGFDKNPQNAGRKYGSVSIKRQLKELLEKEGRIKIEASSVVSIEEDGSVVIKLPSQMQLAMKLQQMAMRGNNNNTLRAIKMIMETIDGKPKQEVEMSGSLGMDLPKKPMKIRMIGYEESNNKKKKDEKGNE